MIIGAPATYVRQGIAQARELVDLLRWIGLRGREFALLLTLTLGQALTDGIGVGLVYPVLAFVANGPEAFNAAAPFPLPEIGRIIQRLGLPLGLPTLLGIVLLAFLLREGLGFLRSSTVSRIANVRASAVQAKALNVYMKADLPFHTAHNRGVIFASVANDCVQSSTLIAFVTEGIALLFMAAFYIMVLSLLSVELTLMIFAGALVALPLFKGQARRVKALGGEIIEANKSFNIRINEAFQAIRLIKVRGQEAPAAQNIAEACRAFAVGVWRRDRSSAALDALLRPIFMFTAMAVFFVALTELNTPFAALVTFIFGTSRLIPLITRLGVLRSLIPSYFIGPNRARQLMREASAHSNVVSGGAEFTDLGSGIRFDSVTFAYAKAAHRPALKGVSFEIRAGERVAVVGPSGAGKSTLVDLLCRFYEPSGGEIRIADRNAKDYELQSYRARISFVPQEATMFDDSIRNNIQYGLPEPLSDEELRDVLKRAHCLDFVDALPQGVNTMIGERAVRLSGGQRQRLALARALANKPKLLLLDEPTSALDSVSEQAIQKTLEELSGQVTMLIVAHRLSTIIDADRIIVMQDGKVVSQGTHSALMADGGVYSDLFKVQVGVAG